MGKRGPVLRKGAPTGVRLEKELRARLDEAARDNARSLSEEIGERLKASFDTLEFPDPETRALAGLIATALATLREQTGKGWSEDPRVFHHAQEAVLETLSFFKPAGDPVVPDDDPVLGNMRAQGILPREIERVRKLLEVTRLGEMAAISAVNMARAVADGKPAPNANYVKPIASTVKAMLVGASNVDALQKLKSGPRKPGSGVKP